MFVTVPSENRCFEKGMQRHTEDEHNNKCQDFSVHFFKNLTRRSKKCKHYSVASIFC